MDKDAGREQEQQEEPEAVSIALPEPAPAKGKAALAQDTAEVPAVRSGPPPGVATSVGPEDLDDVDDLDLADDADDARTRRKARRVTTVLALVAMLGVGFAAGVWYQKDQGASAGSGSLATGLAGHGGGDFPGRLAGLGASGSATSVTGQVSAISGGTIYLSEGGSSALVPVTTSGTTAITVPTSGSVSDIRPGDTVVVQGAKQKDGSYVAASITDSGTSAAATAPSGASSGG